MSNKQWLGVEDKKKVYETVIADAGSSQYYFVMVVLSCTVATYGLLSNSTAVVIGAMLLAPLMSPILGGAMAMAAYNNALFRKSLVTVALGAVTAIVLSAMLTLVLPQADMNGEILARTSPTLLDLVIALASGAAGTYAICFKSMGAAALPGAAIATALMPPLCVVGIGLAKQNVAVVGGAFLLFATNIIAIHIAAFATFELGGFSGINGDYGLSPQPGKENNKRRLVLTFLLLAVVSATLLFMMMQTYKQAQLDKTIKTTLREEVVKYDANATLISADYRQDGGTLDVDAVFRSTQSFSSEYIRSLENVLELRAERPVKINADVVLIQKVSDTGNYDSLKKMFEGMNKSGEKNVEIIRSETPEEIIIKSIEEKITLIKGVKLIEFSFSYGSKNGSYRILAKLNADTGQLEPVRRTVQKVLEERLLRKVDLVFEYPSAQVAK